MNKRAKIFVTNPEEMIGSAILRRLKKAGFNRLVAKSPSELDLTDQKVVFEFFMDEKPDYVFLTSAKIGGILANSRFPAEFIYLNLQCEMNVIHSAWKAGVKKLLFLASSCIYPKDSPQPMKEEYLLTGKLEPTSEPYAVAKIAGIRMCQAYNAQYGANFISVVPGDLYGPGDDFDPETAHVLPSLIARMHNAKISQQPEVVVWGTGSPRREAFHIDDLADACLFLMDNYSSSEMINTGTGGDVSIKELARLIKNVVGFKGKVVFDKSKPDGAPRKLLDVTRIKNLGWSPNTSLEKGIRQTYEWYKANLATKGGVRGLK